MTTPLRIVATGLAFVLAGTACGGSDDGDGGSTGVDSSIDAPDFVTGVRAAIAAVEDQLGDGQEFFEVTSNDQFVNVFVAVDDATAAVPYLFVDGELEAPAPRQDGASGFTFTADDVVFEEGSVLSGVEEQLSTTTVDALSVYGDGVGAIYVLAATSDSGGFLDIQVSPTGDIISVDAV